MSKPEKKKPRVFISYSWALPQYQQRVLDIADRLISEARVDVIIDEYDLNGGQDVVAFIERLENVRKRRALEGDLLAISRNG